MLRAEKVYTMAELRDWARRLHRYGRYPCDAVRRYAIGLYQLHQADDWAGTPSEYESYAAAAVHILAACEALDIPSEEYAPDPRLVDIPYTVGRAHFKAANESMLYLISKLQAQIVYATNSSSIRRKSRFERESAGVVAGELVTMLISKIPPKERTKALYEAMEIMTGEL